MKINYNRAQVSLAGFSMGAALGQLSKQLNAEWTHVDCGRHDLEGDNSGNKLVWQFIVVVNVIVLIVGYLCF